MTTAYLESELGRDELLRHYVASAPHTLESVDQLGNFLMGFGVLALGYLLNANLNAATAAVLGGLGGLHLGLGATALTAWGLSVGSLIRFVHTYITRVIAGRGLHAPMGDESKVGDVLQLPPNLSFEEFISGQRDFDQFVRHNFAPTDREDPSALLYKRWTYTRFMALRKLAEMDRMRSLLGLALTAGVVFKVALVALGALN